MGGNPWIWCFGIHIWDLAFLCLSWYTGIGVTCTAFVTLLDLDEYTALLFILVHCERPINNSNHSVL